MGRPFHPVTHARRRALLVGLPMVLVGGSYAAWHGGYPMGEPAVPAPSASPNAAPPHQAGILISNGAGGNFPVPRGAPVFPLWADAAMSQAVMILHQPGGQANHVLSLSISSPATVNGEPVVAALMLRLDLGPDLPASTSSYRLDGPQVLGEGLVVATRMLAGGRVSRQIFKITGGTITVQPATRNAGAIGIALQAGTAVAAGGAIAPAKGRIQLGSSATMAVPLVVERSGA